MENNIEIKSAIKNVNQPLTLLDLNFQKKLIKVIIEDKQGEFSTQIIDILKPEYFDGIHMKTLIRYILEYVTKYNIIPEYQTLRDIINEKEIEGPLKDNLIELIRLTEEQRITDKLNVKDIALNFCRKQSLKKGLIDAVDNWEKGDYENIAQIISEALKVGEPKSSGHNYLKDMEKRLIKKYRLPVPAMKGLDSKIGGGLAGGELGIILSPTGGGKSMMLVKFACTALEAGKQVVYYTLELQESAIGNRIDSCLTGVPLKNVIEFPDVVKETVARISLKGGNLIIKEFPTGSASLNTMKAHLKVLEREGIIPDVLIIDYADIMKSVSSFAEKRFALTSIYEGLRGMAMEMNIPIWTASQAGRAAINKDSFSLDTISESLGKAQTADVILGIARPDEDKKNKKATMMLLKNRNGEDGYNMRMTFDTSKIDIQIEDENGIGMKAGVKGLNLEAQIRANNA
jgi:replicative DNA helicase